MKKFYVLLILLLSTNILSSMDESDWEKIEHKIAVKELTSLDCAEQKGSTKFSPSGTHILIGAGKKATLFELQSLIDGTADSVAEFEHDNEIFVVNFNKDGSRILTADNAGELKIWKLDEPAKCYKTLSLRLAVYSAEFLDDDRIVTSTADNVITYWDLATSNFSREFKVKSGFYKMTCTPDSKHFISWAYYNDLVHLWEIENSSAFKAVYMHKAIHSQMKQQSVVPASQVYCATFNQADGNYFISGSINRAEIWKLNQSQMPFKSLAHEGSIFSVAWHPSGNYILTGSSKGTVYLWSIDNTQEPKCIIPCSAAIMECHFCPIANYFLIRTLNGQIKIFEFQVDNCLE